MTRDGERREKKQKTAAAAAAAEAAAKERWDLSRSGSQLPLNGRVSQLRFSVALPRRCKPQKCEKYESGADLSEHN